MRRLFLTVAVLILIAAGFYFIRTHRSTLRKLSIISTGKLMKGEDKEQEEDGPEKYIHHEFLLTHDPSTNSIPSERLTKGQELIRLQHSKVQSRTMASNVIWTERGPNNIGGRTRAILIDASDATGNTVWAGSVGGGLWKTTNFKSASPIWNYVSGISENIAITCIAQDPSNPSKMYVGTGEGYNNIDAIRGLGVYQTSNGGGSWSLITSTTTGGANEFDFTYVQKLLVTSSGDLYAACSSKYCNCGGIMKLPNGGSSWARVVGVQTGSCATSTNMIGEDLAKSVNGDIYATTIDGTTGLGHIWKFPFGGSTWSDITPAGTFQRIVIACSATNNNKIYALTQGASSATGGARLSTNGGTAWSSIDVGSWCDQGVSSTDFTRGQAWYDLVIAPTPANDAIVFAGGIDIFKSTNSGTAWAQATQWAAGCAALPRVHADIHTIQFFPGSSTEFIVGCDGGIYYSSNGGTSFTAKNSGYNATQYYGLALHPTAGSDYMLAAAQDNGTHKFTSSGINSVVAVASGDGVNCFIDTDNSNYQFTSYTGASFRFSSNGGASFTDLGSISSDRFLNPEDYDASTDIMYCGEGVQNFARVYNFTAITTYDTYTVASSTNLSVSVVKVDPTTPNRVWIAFSTADGASAYVAPELYIIDNANTTPVATAITLPAGIAGVGNYISSLDVDPTNSAHLILTLSNYGVTSVWETTNTGGSWASIEGNLPDMPVRFCKFLPTGYSPGSRVESVGGILLATELGVWSTSTIAGSSTVWMANNSGMGNVRVDRIELRASDKLIGVATHGRGVFTGAFSTTLPIMLLSFDGHLENGNAVLDWSTSQEQNSKSFDIEKSTDGINYYKIGLVKAAGESTERRDYIFTDTRLGPINYYRLRMNDGDGKNKLSKAVLIRNNNSNQRVWVINNPFTTYIDLRFGTSGSQAQLQLINTTGAIVAEKTVSSPTGQMRWNLPSRLSKGNYILRAIIGDDVFTDKLVKQ